MEHPSFLKDTAIYLGAAVVAVPIFKRLGLGSVLGYLAAGSALGPWGFGLVHDPKSILEFSELGVVLLLFLIGLELKPSRLWNMRGAVFGLGGAQVLFCTLALGIVSYHFGLSLAASFVVGFSLSLSSTAFAIQILSERKQLNTAYGRSAFAVLLFQDMVAIPVLALLPLFSSAVDAPSPSIGGVVRVLLSIGLVAAIGKIALRPLLSMVSRADSREVFSAAALLLVIGVGLVMQSMGLSMALGAFLAGVLLSDSEYRHLLEADIEPFKGMLLGLFFISVGTSVDYGLVLNHPSTIALGLACLLFTKYAVVFVLGKWAGLPVAAARQMAAILPQGGEFAFVIFGVATANYILTPEQTNLLIVIVIASMVATPLLGVAEERLMGRLFQPTEAAFDSMSDDHNPVIIAGFGRVGQLVARILRLQNIGFTTLEKDAEQVKTVRKFGSKVYYGDASRLDLLEAAGARSAKFFVLAIDDVETSVKTAEKIKKHFPHLRIFARARNRQHAFELMDLGITEFWRETFSSTMEMSKALLLEMGTSLDDADHIIRKFREHDENAMLHQHKIHQDETALIQYSKQSVQQLLDSVAADQASQKR